MQHKGEQMKKVRKILLIFLGICLACTTVSCAKRTKVKKGDSYIYCLNSDRTGLQKVSYESKEKDPLKAAKAMIKELKKPSEEIEYTPPIPKDVKVKHYELEGGILYLDFNAKYKQMDTVEETLVRAALVKSLVRIEGINRVRSAPSTLIQTLLIPSILTKDFTRAALTRVSSTVSICLYFALKSRYRIPPSSS